MSNNKIDIVLPTTGNHGWCLAEGWVQSAREMGVLNKVFRPRAKWGAEQPEFDDGLYSHLIENSMSDVVLVMGMDWHSQPLTKLNQWKDAWKNSNSIIIAIIWEDYNSQFVATKKEFYHNMVEAGKRAIECADWIYSQHEDNIKFFWEKFAYNKISFIPFTADLNIFKNNACEKKVTDKLCFKGFIKDFGFKEGPYVQRKKIAEALQANLGENFYFHKDEVSPEEYARILNTYKYHVNLPSLSSSMTSRSAEVLASGGVLFQFKPTGKLTNTLFKDKRDMIFYDPYDISDLLSKVKYYLNNPAEADEIAKRGHKKFLKELSLPVLLKQILDKSVDIKKTHPERLPSNLSKVNLSSEVKRPSISGIDTSIFRQIDLNKVLYADQHRASQFDQQQKINLRKRTLLEYLYTNYCIPTQKKGMYLCISSMVREDYSELFKLILSSIRDEDKIILENYKIIQETRNVEACSLFVELMPYYYAFNARCSLDRAYMYIKLCEYVLLLKKITQFNFANLICFSDMQPAENLIAQYCRLQDKKTITLQHGLYVDYTAQGYQSVNDMNYLYHVSEYFLSWGENTKSLISKYHPDSKVIICGKPIMTTSEKPKNLDGNKNKYCSIVFDQKIFDEENFEMLEIASLYSKKYGLELNVKFHPQNNRHKYRTSGYEFHECLELEQSEFVIGHTSSLIYELMGRDVRVFKYKSDKPCLETPEEIMFRSLDELQNKLKKYVDYKKYYQEYISYSGQESVDKYKKYFAGIN